MAVESTSEAATWISAALAALAAFFLKHLHTRITESASKVELTEAIKKIEQRRVEDAIIADEWKKERRQVERDFFERLVKQDVILARIDERTAKVAS